MARSERDDAREEGRTNKVALGLAKAERDFLAAKVTELEKKLEAALILATELVLELKHYCKEPVHDSQLEELSRQRLPLT